MERPDAGSPAAPGAGSVPPEQAPPVTPASLESETIGPTPPPLVPLRVEAAPSAGAAASVPAGLAEHSRYRVLRLLGQGGMGSVFLAEHRHMERQVALKVINPEMVNNSDAVRRFRQEVTAAARLGPHPNIVAVHDAEQVGDLHFLAMEFVEGESLADYLRVKGPLSVAEACDCVRQAALGLQHASEQGMVHRDIKPHNLMRTPQGQVKVLDFGLARCGRDADKARTQLTQQGVLMGTADYMAPEQANDSRVADIRADIYSLGCTLYHLLTGRVPYPEGGTVDKIIKHAVEAPRPVGALRRDLPLEVVRIVEKMMEKSPERRFQTPVEVAAALAPWCVANPRTTAPMTVIPVNHGSALARRPQLRPRSLSGLNSVAFRRIRWTANWLMVGGYLNGFLGFTMLFLPNVFPYFAPIAMLVSTLILIGAIKMKARQSYRWAMIAAYLTLVPASFCFPFTVFFGIRALSCLSDPQVRAAFPS